MHDKKIAVMFHGGSYGHYLGWLLGTMFLGYDVVSPFGKNGTSHGEVPHKKMLDMQGNFDDYQGGIALLHPKHPGAMDIAANINKTINFFDKTIFLYPSKSLYLSSVNNYVYKAKPANKSIFETTLSYIDMQNAYNNFNVEPGTSLENLPRWILREILSFNLFASWENQVEWYFPNHYSAKLDKMLFVYVNDLLYNTNTLIGNIAKFLDMQMQKSFEDVKQLHMKNLQTQKYLTQDKIADDVLQSFYNATEIQFDPAMTLVTESYIQKHLRDNGYELLCDGLNVFPTSTKELKSRVQKIE